MIGINLPKRLLLASITQELQTILHHSTITFLPVLHGGADLLHMAEDGDFPFDIAGTGGQLCRKFRLALAP